MIEKDMTTFETLPGPEQQIARLGLRLPTAVPPVGN
jgi:hypothetical protein